MFQKIKQYTRNNKAITCLNLFLIAIFFVPYSYSDGLNGEQFTNYTILNDELLISNLTLIPFTIAFQIMKKGFLRKLFLIIDLVIFFVAFLSSLFYLSMPLQDFIPGIGILLMLFLFPLTILIYSIENYETP